MEETATSNIARRVNGGKGKGEKGQSEQKGKWKGMEYGKAKAKEKAPATSVEDHTCIGAVRNHNTADHRTK